MERERLIRIPEDREDLKIEGAFRGMFPDCEWCSEGCGISPKTALELMKKSISTKHDYLSDKLREVCPDYSSNVFYD
ncbi:hypothetical protein [Olegusella massiliensis]|uniref:hypothetical protein n=1 Tax=Olegusella massiliensis TaxID=1776381 RepID=UPI0008382348|nr:hypothetical protein [Olegusella massiliensis]